MRVTRQVCTAVLVMSAVTAANAEATEWFVAPGGLGAGTKTAPFARIQDGLTAAQPGDIVTVAAGTYEESLTTTRSGTASAPIRVRAAGERGTAIVTFAGRVLTINHAHVTVEGLVLDGQYGLGDAVRVATTGNYFTLRNTEVRRSTNDLIDIGGPTGVVIEECLIHHALNAANGRTDAHGIVAGPVKNLTVRNTEVHTFSGDGFQVDPGRSAPGWSNVVLEDVRFWLAPLAAPENGFAAGVVPGENAVDTKAAAGNPRATLTIRNATAWGFRKGLITNMAAFNLKENINATLDRITVYDSEIAFRLRGGGGSTSGAWVTLKNAVVHDVTTAYRYEDEIRNLHIWNNTLGAGITRAFQAANSTTAGVDVRNVLILGSRPAQAVDASNLAVGTGTFADVSRHDYRLAAGSPAIDGGVTISAVSTDRNGVARPVGAAYDVGAYEWQPPDPAEVVAAVFDAPIVVGKWRVVSDAMAAGGTRLSHPDQGAAVISTPRQTPTDYFELAVYVEAGRDYRLWLRGRADRDSPRNDSVYVQFSGAISRSGAPLYRIGTPSAATVTLEDCPGCGLRGWGWQDNGSGVETLGPLVRFAASGPQVVRVQTREDGLSIDQIVLSPVAYLTAAPGQRQNDTAVLAGM